MVQELLQCIPSSIKSVLIVLGVHILACIHNVQS